jgi:uncharacterized membrane protein (UPF0127 family)
MPSFVTPLLAGIEQWQLVNAATGSVVADCLEGAFDSESRRRGLLGRTGLDERAAVMIAPCNGIHTCFMRFPIDVIFAARDGQVLKVCANVAPWRLAASLRAYVAIEVVGGRAARAGVNAGDRVALVHVDPTVC